MLRCLCILFLGLVPAMGDGPDLPALKVQGTILAADGQPFRLRGINWGWWHLQGTRYSEADMKHLADWGANTVRLAFSYNDLETDDNPPAWKEDGFRDLDDVVQWGKKYGIYVILDMHVAPGGQDTQAYCAGGKNLLWSNPAAQQHFIDLWTEIARRYVHRPEVAAYELMNEPGTKQPTAAQLLDLDQRTITAIRAVDPDKVIVVGGDRGSGPDDLNDGIHVSDSNVLYTFHFYFQGKHTHDVWLKNVKNQEGISGSQDWVKLEDTVTVPEGADEMTLILRSDDNSGTAWFDDAEIDDASGKPVQTATFDTDAQDFRPEKTDGTMTFDSTTGHDKPGSVKISGTSGYNGWKSGYVSVQPGETRHVSAWVKLDQATGQTYLTTAFFHNKGDIDRTSFQNRVSEAVNFSAKFGVPVWVGEFGCDASDKDYQSAWVSTCISTFEDAGFSWTYWNDKETTDSQGMALQPENKDGSDRLVNDSLLNALQAGWAKNKSP
jgi:aryl-phospho-beta-D-glucosidase BglC (GH1 family)